MNTLALSNVANVSTTGTPSLRLAISGRTPTGQNYVRFNTYDSGTNRNL